MSERLTSRLETREQEPFGHNIEVHAHFLRHGPKDQESGRLTEEGLEAAEKYGEEFEPSSSGKQYMLKAYSSGIGRATETAEAIVKNVNTERKGRTRIRLELGEEKEGVKMITVDALNLPYSEYIKVNRTEEKIGDKSVSLHGLAQRVAEQIEHFVKMSERFKSNSIVDLINITHLPWISAFIKEIVGKEIEKGIDPERRQKLEEKITNLGYLKGFELVIKRDGENAQLMLKIDDKDFAISEENIKKILSD